MITNSLQGLEKGKMSRRIAYAFFLAVGLLFLISAVITAFGIVSAGMTDIGSAGYRYLLFVCYLLLSLTISYGFIFCRAWIVPVLGIQGVAMIGLWAFRTIEGRGSASQAAFSAVAFAVLFAVAHLNRSLLQGKAFRKAILAAFFLLMLTTLFLVNTNLVY